MSKTMAIFSSLFGTLANPLLGWLVLHCHILCSAEPRGSEARRFPTAFLALDIGPCREGVMGQQDVVVEQRP